jgi:hypothetical protein
MTISKLSAADAQQLFCVAELLLWFGLDRAADFVFAALEAECPPRRATAPPAPGQRCSGAKASVELT